MRSDPAPRIRTVALGVIRRGDEILVAREVDSVAGRRYHRPPGGGVEFGERAAEAVARELREELCVEIEAPALLGVIENLFTFGGLPGHEIVFVFEARVRDAGFYARETVPLVEHDGTLHEAVWLPLAALDDASAPVYPPGLSDLVRAMDRA